MNVLGRELSLSRSAEQLHTTQPALSRSLAQLEDLLGEKPFNRSTRRVSMTPAGAVLMQHANRILAEIDLIEENLAGMQGGTRGQKYGPSGPQMRANGSLNCPKIEIEP